MKGAMTVDRLRTRASWDYEDAGTQFLVANVMNPRVKEIDMSKTEGDLRDRVKNESTTEDDDAFCEERMSRKILTGTVRMSRKSMLRRMRTQKIGLRTGR